MATVYENSAADQTESPPPYINTVTPATNINYNNDRDMSSAKHEQLKDSDPDEKPVKVKDDRGSWGNKVEFLLACIGLAVGLGNVWRFPYLCHKHGGGAFLIPYFICLVFEGLPLMYLEMAVGQFFRSGSINCWAKIHPMLKGIGIGSVAVSIMLCLYYVIVIARCFLYLFLSFTKDLPFTECAEDLAANASACCAKDKANYFWWNNVLQASTGLSEVENFSWELVGCLVLAWVICYICVFKGVESSGKAVYFTATFPYVCLLILFFRGVTLPGADIGVKVYITPKFERLLDGAVWLDAATQIFFSLSLGFGALIAFASYVPYKNYVGRDAMIVSLVNCGTSVFAGFVIYSILGFREHKGAGKVEQVTSGSGLAFVAISEAVSEMKGAPVWACFFFIMLILLGLDSEFGTLEGAVTPLVIDMKLFGKIRKEIVSAGFAIVLCLMGLLFCTGIGEYLVGLFDSYAMNIPILILALFECIAVGWVFGTDNMSLAIEDMQGSKPSKFFTICWKYISPGLLILIFFITFVQQMMAAPKYTSFIDCVNSTHPNSTLPTKQTIEVPYSIGAQIAGWIIVILAIMPIPLFMIINRKSEAGQMGAFLKSIANSVRKDREYNMESLYYRPQQGHDSPVVNEKV